ncbi:hypothetical protein SAMN02745166_01488 [Prosthecobacter debontii]|uniref:Uncharacterized protein n=1 Tax=Prosthecobacter debontii TaxID=48467 RepID=A0A1T4XH38_9BACT|nr:hypothetical protein [Prosthecobacter debontii]SKA88799.1 hypothetical protein SAMN02745166_01488 [Prosthecobacter debontii]
MSTTQIHNFAQQDTPNAVYVPKSWRGLLIWAVGRFGSGILLAAACSWALMRVYDDHATQTRQLMTILEQRARVDSEMTVTLHRLSQSIDELRRDAASAHRLSR